MDHGLTKALDLHTPNTDVSGELAQAISRLERALPMNWDEGPVLLLLLPGEGDADDDDDADDALLLVLFVLLPTKCSSKPRPITANGLT